MSDAKLKPCPFCGEGPKIMCSTRGKIAIQCVSDHCDTAWQTRFHHTQEEAVSWWNRRAAPEWSTDLPTESGWYWVLVDHFKPFPVRIVDYGYGFQVMQPGEESLVNLSEVFPGHHAQWLRIPDPELPPKE